VVFRLILPDWLKATPGWNSKELPPVLEGEYTDEDVIEFNRLGYNCYYLPNYPSSFDPEINVTGAMIDTFTCVFVDMDMKHGDHATKDDFIREVLTFKLVPSRVVDSGNGVHAYWDISDLTDMDFLRFQRRLCRHFKTDPAIAKLYQLMRVPGTVNWKNPDDLKLCELVYTEDRIYTCEELDKALPRIAPEDESYCKAHYDKTHGLGEEIAVSDQLPLKWFKFCDYDNQKEKQNPSNEAFRLFYRQNKDRSAADYRLAHLLFAAGFTKEEAMAVLCQTNKATERVGVHKYNYAEAIVTKVWIYVNEPEKATELLSRSVRSILDSVGDEDTLKGTRFECDPHFDATEHGFRLTQVMGVIGGAGAGKTMFGFNVFKGFARRNPQYIHLAVTLEQPELEYAQRWKKMSEGNPALLESVHILGNYNDDGTYRHLSLQDIEDYVKLLEKQTHKKVGAVMIDHIGVLNKETRSGEFQGLMDICQYMKAFAVNTNTFLIMQSQAPREKASIGDIELDKDAAYGTAMFEWFCDFIVTLWQPLKRVYDKAPNMTITCFKFCKIRHKNVLLDKIKEDQRYALFMNPVNDTLRELTDTEMKSLDFLMKQATQLRGKDKRTEPGRIAVIDWTRPTKGKADARNPSNGSNPRRT
jgi:hypothetical protein